MRRSTLWVLAAVLLMPASLALPSECDARENSEFPTLNQLRQSNVALIMEGFQFASGLKRNSKGKINGKGFQLLKSSGVGSGFIATSDGSVITNYHVADKALRMKAMFDDKSTYEIRHISVYDPANDLAILKISSDREFRAVQLGNSDEVQPMDRVLAVGNPRGLGINITKGDVSQVERDDDGRAQLVRHTAPITSGNSGGSLYKGTRVIGVNASIVRAAIGGESRFGQAIPINKAKWLLKKYHGRKTPLTTAFPTDPKVFLKKKFKSIDSGTGLVPAAIPGQKKPGIKKIGVRFHKLKDYVILLKSPGKDLSIIVTRSGKIIGYGDMRETGYEGVIITSKHDQNVTVNILNYDAEPARFGIRLGTIQW